MTTTATCPGCGVAVITLTEIPGKPGRLQGCCGCNDGRPVLEMNAPQAAPKVEKKKRVEVEKESGEDEQESSVLDGGNGEDGSGGAVPEVP